MQESRSTEGRISTKFSIPPNEFSALDQKEGVASLPASPLGTPRP